jgi:stage V sporulation protein D (sporulation-specific penicillin-binding protein)
MATFVTRIRILAFLFIFIGIVLICKLYVVQVINHKKYLNLGDRQYLSKNSSILDRGNIFFTTKDGTYVTAATMRNEYTLYLNPKSVYTFLESDKNIAKKSKDDMFSDLKKRIVNVLKLDQKGRDDLDLKFTQIEGKRNDTYFELMKGLSEDGQIAIKSLQLDYLGLGKENKRYYPGNGLAANVIGTVGFQGDEIAGRYGIEKQYENTLIRSSEVYSNFFVDLFSGAKKVISDRENLEGDVYTTIEPTVQKELEKKILKINADQNSELTGGIIMNPYTGEIIAMAKAPSFTHDDNVKYDISNYKNDIVENSYEMGSIIKPLTMSVAIDLDKAHADTTYDDKGFVKVKDRTIYNFDKKGRGVIPMQTALSQSLNTGFVYIARLIGNEMMTKYFYSFGMNKKTDIDLPNESAPLTANLDKGDVEHATASFGQGIALSPIGTIRALSVVANGGYVINPHVVNKIKYTIGTSNDIKPMDLTKQVPVLKESTIAEIRKMMVYNVDNALLNGARKNPHYTIAAKTGTAQIPSPTGGYLDGKNVHTFIGFFPAYHPQFIIFMYTVAPKVSPYASQSLAPSFLDLSDFLIQYYDIPSDR